MNIPSDSVSHPTEHRSLADPSLKPIRLPVTEHPTTRSTSGSLGKMMRGVADLHYTLLHTDPASSLITLNSALKLSFPKEVLGTMDSRSVATQPRSWPWRTVGHLKIRYPNGRTGYGTGVLVGPHHVLTAGHCVYSEADGKWARWIEFVPARDGAAGPADIYYATELLSVTGWTTRKNAEEDYGLILLDQAAGLTFGWMGLHGSNRDADILNRAATISGYPDDKRGYRQHWDRNQIVALHGNLLKYEIDTFDGQSGSPIWHQFAPPQEECIVGVHRGFDGQNNEGVRIDFDIFTHLIEWIAAQ